jgi:hypothetical protein
MSRITPSGGTKSFQKIMIIVLKMRQKFKFIVFIVISTNYLKYYSTKKTRPERSPKKDQKKNPIYHKKIFPEKRPVKNTRNKSINYVEIREKG